MERFWIILNLKVIYKNFNKVFECIREIKNNQHNICNELSYIRGQSLGLIRQNWMRKISYYLRNFSVFILSLSYAYRYFKSNKFNK